MCRLTKELRVCGWRVVFLLPIAIGGLFCGVRWRGCVAEQQPPVPAVPDLPILAACHQYLTNLAQFMPVPDNVMPVVDLGEPATIAWVDGTHLIVRTELPDIGVAQLIRSYLWGVSRAPELLTGGTEARLSWGQEVAFGARYRGKTGECVDEVHIGYDTVCANWTDTSLTQGQRPAYSFPPMLRLPLIPDWGKAGPASRRRVQILDQRAAVVVDAEAPGDLPICGWTQGCATEEKDRYVFAALTVQTAEECGRWDQVPYEVTVIAVPKDGRAARVVGSAEHGAPLVDLGDLELLERFCAFRHAVLAGTGICYLTRGEEYATQKERLALVSLWRWDLGGKRQLIDVLGWYRGPESHQYLLTLDPVKGLRESSRRFDRWGPARELVPGISPGGDRIAYAKDKSIWVINMAEAR